MSLLDAYAADVYNHSRAAFMQLHPYPFLLVKLSPDEVNAVLKGGEKALQLTDQAARLTLDANDNKGTDPDFGSRTMVTQMAAKTSSFSVLKHNAQMYRIFALKKALAIVPRDPWEEKDIKPLPPATTLGRAEGNDVIVQDISVSKKHAYFLAGPPGDVQLVDRASRNGTTVRGKKLSPDVATPVNFGDPIAIGSLAMTLIGAGALYETVKTQGS